MIVIVASQPESKLLVGGCNDPAHLTQQSCREHFLGAGVLLEV